MAVDNDLVRGVMATDALIGTFAGTDDPSLQQNVCFLYHLLGGGTGDWDVPIGGMGAVTAALAAAAARYGAEIITGADVYAINPDGEVRLPGRRCGHPGPRPLRAGRGDTRGAGDDCSASLRPRSRRARR